MVIGVIPALVLLGCQTGSGPSLAEALPATDTLPQLEPAELLVRASLDLRGVRPSIDELDQVAADPEVVDDLLDGFLQDPRFGDRIVSLYSSIYLTRLDYYYVKAEEYGLYDEPTFARSVGEEPLRILARIATEDLPYTEIVTADWTMADESLGTAFPVDYPSDGDGWEPVQYNDDRPMAGVLSTNSMWWRYSSTSSNANRGRANAVSRILLCSDYLVRPIEFDRDVNLLDAGAVSDALANNPGCVACHHSLDPLASYFWGFFYYNYTSKLDITEYHPEREFLWESYTGVAPSYHGEPGYTLADLGDQIARDPRLIECAVEQAWELLLQRETLLDDTDPLVAHREVFLDSGLTMRSLVRSILGSPEYRSGPTDDPRAVPLKMVTPDLLASQLEALTGYRFTYYGYDMMQTDTYGLRTLAGGVDGAFVTTGAREPIPTLVLVQQRLAEAAADHVIDHDRANPDAPRLFTHLTFGETPVTGRDAMVLQLQDLHLSFFGTRIAADGPEIDANLALWDELFSLEPDPVQAWKGLTAALLRDPAFLFY